MENIMRVAISGPTGFIGCAIVSRFKAKGFFKFGKQYFLFDFEKKSSMLK